MTTGRFTKVLDGDEHVATTDNKTGLTWSVKPVLNPDDEGEISFAAAEAACAALTIAGNTDWRLPTREELQTILDLTKHSPAIDNDAFPGTESDWYWTSTPCAWSSDLAWIVNFSYGLVSYDHRDLNAFVRAVRGGNDNEGTRHE